MQRHEARYVVDAPVATVWSMFHPTPPADQVGHRVLEYPGGYTRSIGPALVGFASNPGAVAQLWLFIIAPLIGAGIAGFLFKRGGVLSADND